MYDDLKATFTKDQLRELKVPQLKKLFEWFGIEYPVGKRKNDIIELVFREEIKQEDQPMSARVIRLRRINYGN